VFFLDESGVMMAPLVRRTQAPRGKTPILKHKAGREKVSLIAGLSLSPLRGRLNLYFGSLVNDHFDHSAVAHFLRQVLRHLRGNVIVIWDRGPMHRGPELRTLEEDHPRLSFELLPAYAPKANPVEQIWTDLKWGKLCNLAPQNVHQLKELATKELSGYRRAPERLRNFIRASALPWPRALAS
jgi:transposase